MTPSERKALNKEREKFFLATGCSVAAQCIGCDHFKKYKRAAFIREVATQARQLYDMTGKPVLINSCGLRYDPWSRFVDLTETGPVNCAYYPDQKYCFPQVSC